MIHATLLIALIASTAADRSGDPVLLDFTATWCGPCREMRPEVEKLVQKGYPIRAIDIDRSPEMAERYQVRAVPTFVVVDAKGKVLSRASGFMPAIKLATFYNEAKAQLPPQEPIETVEDTDPHNPSEGQPVEEGSTPAPLVNPKPWETVVRIKMHLSETQWGFGSGTVIYSSAQESIILTCAHIFRIPGKSQQPNPTNYPVKISVDLFDGQLVTRQPAMINCSERDLVGQAIDYDFVNDVGLIRIKPGRVLPASRVVPPDWKPKKGMHMYTVGCSHGQDATAWDTSILDPRVTMSNSAYKEQFATIKCANQPKEGRSGGGLYTSDGYVAGVCDFADPNERVGLYAVPEAIHKMLDRNRMMALYRRGDSSGALLASDQGRGKTGTYYRAQNAPLREPAPAPDAISLPPFDMVASRQGGTASGSKAWQRSTDPANPTRSNRSTVRPGETTSPDVRAGEAMTTDLTLEPSAEDKAFNRPEPPSSSRNQETPPSAGTRPANGWKRSPRILPDLSASDRSR